MRLLYEYASENYAAHREHLQFSIVLL